MGQHSTLAGTLKEVKGHGGSIFCMFSECFPPPASPVTERIETIFLDLSGENLENVFITISDFIFRNATKIINRVQQHS
jgi:hypothetical protein